LRWQEHGLGNSGCSGGCMDGNEQYSAAVARCEAAAREHGHTLDVWYHVSEELHASVCAVCGAMVWVTRPGHEKRWRIGGVALEQECPEEHRSVEAGA
jgi:hypothetical protein